MKSQRPFRSSPRSSGAVYTAQGYAYKQRVVISVTVDGCIAFSGLAKNVSELLICAMGDGLKTVTPCSGVPLDSLNPVFCALPFISD